VNITKGNQAKPILATTKERYVPEEDENYADSAQRIETAPITFEYATTNLTKESKKALDDVVQTLGDVTNTKLAIYAFTDSTGTKERNKKLSKKRAESVKSELVKMGIPAQNITTYAMGESHPIADNKTPQGRQKNRRIEIFKISEN
jgi:outer membrane protein OmpA-like peptidoglycan-associated protein